MGLIRLCRKLIVEDLRRLASYYLVVREVENLDVDGVSPFRISHVIPVVPSGGK